jgi:hypothetical protein
MPAQPRSKQTAGSTLKSVPVEEELDAEVEVDPEEVQEGSLSGAASEAAVEEAEEKEDIPAVIRERNRMRKVLGLE